MSNSPNSNTNQGGQENKKVILLDLSRTERAFEETESLWDIEIEKIEERLTGHQASLEEYGEEEDIGKKPLLSIAILGYPGSGKTSMLHTLVERIKKGKLENVSSLPVIKPKLVAEGDHFLYAFLAEALRMDREEHKHENDQDRETPFISRVQHKFQEVSEYLQVLNETGQKHEGDPLGVSLERLERHESGLMLIEKMTGFIDELANSLGGNTKQSVVLLPVDDADMSKEVLTSALDTCWRFIKHPRLVPIFSFTGRLAEELMRINYENKLDSDSSIEKLKETSTSMLITENMAIQHLGKLFPVRNRIKMGPAAARVQVAEYRPYKGGPVNKVSDLLEKASTLLFGHTQLLGGHSIRPPLRMVTLRRQIQIIDAIQGTGIQAYIGENNKTDPQSSGSTFPDTITATVGDNTYKYVKTTRESGYLNEEPKTWSEIFDQATWSLLNAHRDVLKEFNLNLDDLYSWTPKGLRQVILDCILMQKKSDLSKLHKQWRYRNEDRRSQVISLLAVNTFRPRMDEEPTEDDTPEIIKEWRDNRKKFDRKQLEETGKSFPVPKGALWFLYLCTGFYLPQVFSTWSRLPGDKEKDMEDSRVTGIGWGLMSGPLHAVREALKRKKVFSSGILFLDPVEFSKSLEKSGSNKNKRFFSHIWCYYGFYDDWPWVAVSLWRGLGLMGKVIEVFENYRKCSHDHSNCILREKNNGNEENIHYKILKQKIEKVIKRHFESARVFSNLPKGKEIASEYQDLDTESWEYKEDTGTNPESKDSIEAKISDFAGAMISWLEESCSVPIEGNNGNETKKKETKRKENRLFPMGREKEGEEGEEEKEKRENENRESCFIRRLHGDNLMSIFWQDLENAYFKKGLMDWSAGLILYRWKKLLSQYWDGCDQIKNLLESCPIWPDFKSHLVYKEKNVKFDWGKVVTVSPVHKYEEEAGNAKTQFAEGYKNKNTEALGKLKVEYVKKLDKEKKNLQQEEEKLAKENNKEVVEKNIKNIKTYNLIVEERYNRQIGISRANLEKYELFSEKPSSTKVNGSLTIPDESKKNGDVPGKVILFNAVVSNKKEESKAKGNNENGGKQ